MATIIPAEALNAATGGERKLLRKLHAGLPPECLLWHGVELPGSYQADVVCYIPARGLIIFEVKDWGRDTILTCNKDGWVICDEGKDKGVKSPLTQVRNYFYRLKELFEKKNLLLAEGGSYKGKFKIPIAYAVVFPNISRADLPEGIGDVLPYSRILSREDLDALGDSVKGPEATAFLGKYFSEHFWPNEALNENERNILISTIYPEKSYSPKSKNGAVNYFLDGRQAQLVERLESGHHIIRGIAGSGKSLVLCAKAQLLARSKPDAKILLVCFNTSLKSQLDFYLQSFNGDKSSSTSGVIHVFNFHKFIDWQAKKAGDEEACQKHLNDSWEHGDDDGQSAMLGEYLRGLALRPDTVKYDAILIDESQDFHYSWLKGLRAFIKPEPHLLILAEDFNQKIYHRKFTYKGADINVQGRVRKLPMIYRSTREIIVPAMRYLHGEKFEDSAKQYLTMEDCVANNSSGNMPDLRLFPNDVEVFKFIVDDIRAQVENGAAFSDIGVFHPFHNGTQRIAEYLEKHGIPVYWLAKDNLAKKNFSLSRNAVVVSTIHSAKGLEFDHVYFSGIECFPLENLKLTERENASIVYVGMTRAKRRVVLISTKENQTILKLRAALAQCADNSGDMAL
ncbi:MAG: NERD domain-containing protein [Elusimicrobia bacterium]|nr:NERD domain-containing protein [Elusimicrobiota bacterium]